MVVWGRRRHHRDSAALTTVSTAALSLSRAPHWSLLRTKTSTAMQQRTLRLLKQTLHPPRRTIPLAANPLTRWSRHLPHWFHLAGVLTNVAVGLEGCHSAFNATNSIRTALYFQTAAPPTFLTAASWKAIEHVQTRPNTHNNALTASSSSSSSSSDTPALSSTVPVSASDASPFAGIAFFGEEAYFSGRVMGAQSSEVAGGPIVAVENFTDRAQSLMQTRLPSTAPHNPIRLVVGHENRGVRRSLLRPKAPTRQLAQTASVAPVADMVVYVPQYGTISSLNVVTSLGIALFYCYVDENCPSSRTVYQAMTSSGAEHVGLTGKEAAPKSGSDEEAKVLRERIQAYQDYFKRSLPAPPLATASATPSAAEVTPADAHSNTTPRLDRRPIHPVFYQQGMTDIMQLQQRYREALLQYSRHGREASAPYTEDSKEGLDRAVTATTPPFFGLSVLYENEYDQRNFGGLIRNANAFLVDHILYVGRRKYNVVGAVGSYHYTPPIYLGPLPSEEDGEQPEAVCDSSSAEAGKKVEDWSTSLKAKVEALYSTQDKFAASSVLHPTVPREWWLLDCGHGFLYEENSATGSEEEGEGQDVSVARSPPSPPPPASEARTFAVSAASLRLYRALLAQGRVRHLCQPEAALRSALSGGVVLMVPQEGKLPHVKLMQLCTGVLTVLPPGAHYAQGCELTAENSETQALRYVGHRGLPSQVASGIALQRLSAVLHPRLAAL